MTSNLNGLFQGCWNGDISKSQCGGGEEEKIVNEVETQISQGL